MELIGDVLLAQIYTPIPSFIGGMSFAGVALAARGERNQRLVVRVSIAVAVASVMLFFVGYSGSVINDPSFGGGSNLTRSPPIGAPIIRAQTTLNFLLPGSTVALAAELFARERMGLRIVSWTFCAFSTAVAVFVAVSGLLP